MMRLQLRRLIRDSDTMDGEDGTADVLKLSTGKHTFGDDDKLKNIEKIETNSSGSEVILSAQKEALEITGGDGVDKITGGEGADTIKGGKGNDEITVAAAGRRTLIRWMEKTERQTF